MPEWFLPYSELFTRLGLGPTATQLFAAVQRGDLATAQRCLAHVEAVLTKTKNLKAAAGTLFRMRTAVQSLLTAAEVAPAAAAEVVTLSAEGAELMGAGTTLTGAAEVGTVGMVTLEAEAPAFALGPVGWAVIAVTVFVFLMWAMSRPAHAEQVPSQPGPKPPGRLPETIRRNPLVNPAVRINRDAHNKFAEYKQMKKKICRCYGAAPLGGLITGRPLAMGPAPTPSSMCSWPKCPPRSHRA